MRKIMKKILFIILFFPLLPTLAWSGIIVIGQPAGCSTPSLGANMTEGYEGTGYEESWTEISSPNEDYDITGISPPSGACSQGFYVTVSGGAEQGARYDHGSTHDVDTTALTIKVHIYLSGGYSGDGLYLGSWGNSTTVTTNQCAYLWLRDNSGTAEVRASGSTNSSWIALTDDTWHEITLVLATTPANSTVKVDSGSEQGFTRWSNDVRYHFVGAVESANTADNGTVVIYDLYNY
jgi:hypothetical protein